VRKHHDTPARISYRWSLVSKDGYPTTRSVSGEIVVEISATDRDVRLPNRDKTKMGPAAILGTAIAKRDLAALTDLPHQAHGKHAVNGEYQNENAD